MNVPEFSLVNKSNVVIDNRGRVMQFPTRRDYVDHLIQEGLIEEEKKLPSNSEFVEAIYLDWLRRAQVGCVFAQLFGRTKNRKRMRTKVFNKSHDPEQNRELASKIDAAVQDAIDDPNLEAISVLLPELIDAEILVHLLLSLSELPKWTIEREWQWRGTLTLIGLRRQIADNVWAEILGLGPFQFLPPTRQGPITTLEIRTKGERSIWSKLYTRRSRLAAHLAQLSTDEFLTRKEHQVRFKKWTPELKKRILGGNSDGRAKANVTFAVPAAVWDVSKSRRS